MKRTRQIDELFQMERLFLNAICDSELGPGWERKKNIRNINTKTITVPII